MRLQLNGWIFCSAVRVFGSSGSSRWGKQARPGFWYDQDEGEWVLLLAGAARLRFEDEPKTRQLAPGDVIDVSPHRRHRIDWTDPLTPTIWLAVFYRSE